MSGAIHAWGEDALITDEIDVQNNLSETELLCFLLRVNTLFPVPLSIKTDLNLLANKLIQYGTISCIKKDGQIVALCAGYTNDLSTRMGYISVVACLPECSHRGYGKRVVRNFLATAKHAGMWGVHLYTVDTNYAAMYMYKQCNFVNYVIDGEKRPNDRHLVHWFI